MKNITHFCYITLFCLAPFLAGCQTTALSQEEAAVQVHENEEKKEYLNRTNFSQVSVSQPKQIALLLPLSGKHADSAKAIREGFFASYYQANGEKPQVRIYDTTKNQDIHQVYDLALQEGADFVVGPLAKEDVHRLSQLPDHKLKTPVLALNQHPAVRPTNHNFVQFTLAPESEVEQIAERAWQQGHRSASVVVPTGAWGKRVAQAFNTRWQNMGGRTLHTVYANPNQDQSGAVRNLLGIDQSQQRANHIKNLLTEKVDFQPRRRQDVDVIVMAAPPEQARQLKPLFDFYYADDIPVFATSSIYGGKADPKKDRDINGIVFCDMPGLVDQQRSSNLKELLNRNGGAHSDQYNRLFAMGADAYHLTGHFTSLQQTHGTTYPGITGNLSVDNNNQIARKLAWAKIVKGAPTQVN